MEDMVLYHKDFQPSTHFYGQDERRWNQCLLPDSSDCPECNRIGIWKTRGDGIASLLTPCFECACESYFIWYEQYPINGIRNNDTVLTDQSIELKNHEVIIMLINIIFFLHYYYTFMHF